MSASSRWLARPLLRARRGEHALGRSTPRPPGRRARPAPLVVAVAAAVGVTVTGAGLAVAPAAGAAAGDLDGSFGTGGVTVAPAFPLRTEQPSRPGDTPAAVVTQPDGRILVAGASWENSSGTERQRMSLLRLLPDGTVDPTFGTGGWASATFRAALTPTASASSVASDLALQPDGKVVVVGRVVGPNAGNTDVAMARFLPDGTLDPSFGVGGTVVTNVEYGIGAYPSNSTNWAESVVLDGDRILVGGSTYCYFCGHEAQFFVARYLPNGALDTTWGAGASYAPPLSARSAGIVTTGWGCSNRSGHLTDLALQPDGRLVAAGYRHECASTRPDFAVARYDRTGRLDATFGIGGKVEVTMAAYGSQSRALVVQRDGRIVAAGYADDGDAYNRTQRFALARLLPNGALDPTFDGDGRVITPGYNEGGLHDLAVQADGRLVGAASDWGIVRYAPSGALDTTWGGTGVVRTRIQAGSPRYLNAVTVQRDGRIVGAGWVGVTGQTPRVAVARYAPALVAPDEPVVIGSHPDPVTADPDAVFTFTHPDPDVELSCSLDGAGPVACTSPVRHDDLAEGSHTFRVAAAHPGGPAGSPTSFVWTVDQTPPGAPTITSAPPPHSNVAAPTFTFAHPEPDARFECSLDGLPLARCTSPLTVDDLGEGAHTFTVVAVDLAGNRSVAAEHRWTIDVTAPEPPTISDGPSGSSDDLHASFVLTHPEPDATFECSLDGAILSPCVSPVTFDDLTEGSHTFAAYAVDVAGNRSVAATRGWHVRFSTDLRVDPLLARMAANGPSVPLRPSATLSERASGAPLAGRVVSFWSTSVGSESAELLCVTMTDERGVAACGPVEAVQGSSGLGYDARFDGDATHRSAAGAGGLVEAPLPVGVGIASP